MINQIKKIIWAIMILAVVTISFAEDKKTEKTSDEKISEQNQAEKLYQEAWYKETALNDFKGAIEIYQKIVDSYPDNKTTSVKALFQIGNCYEKLGKNNSSEAIHAYQRLVNEYPNEDRFVDEAKIRLKELKPAEADKNEEKIQFFRKEIVKLLQELDSEGFDPPIRPYKEKLTAILEGIENKKISSAQEVRERLLALYKETDIVPFDEIQNMRKKILIILEGKELPPASVKIITFPEKSCSLCYLGVGYVYTNFNNKIHINNDAGFRVELGFPKSDFFLEYRHIDTKNDLVSNMKNVSVDTFQVGMFALSVFSFKAGAQRYLGTNPNNTAPILSFDLGLPIHFAKDIFFCPAGSWDIVWTKANDDKIHQRKSKSFTLSLGVEF